MCENMKVKFADPEVALLNSILKFEEITMKTIDNIVPIRSATVEVDRKVRGEDIRLPIWLAEYLIDKGKISISEKLLKTLTQNIWRELAQPTSKLSIAKIDSSFYNIIYIYNYLLKKGAIIGGRPVASRDDIRTVINKRREVISKLSSTDLGILEDRLTFQEKILLKKIRGAIKEWDRAIGLT
jgi:hypothetical protein